MSYHRAPEGQIYVCSACGKTSRSNWGWDPETGKHDNISDGWDSSCMTHAVLVSENVAAIMQVFKVGDRVRATYDIHYAFAPIEVAMGELGTVVGSPVDGLVPLVTVQWDKQKGLDVPTTADVLEPAPTP